MFRLFRGVVHGTTSGILNGPARRLVENEPTTPGSTAPGIVFFFGGVLLGVLISAAFGWDLYPQSSKTVPSVSPGSRVQPGDLEDQLRRLEQESGLVARDLEAALQENGRLKKLLAKRDRPPKTIAAEELLALLDEKRWEAFGDRVMDLLKAKEKGFPILVEVARAIVHTRMEAIGDGGAAFSLMTAAILYERRVAELISYTLRSSVFKEDPVFAERVLWWSSRFFVSADDSLYSARADLVQNLQKRLEVGGLPIWVVLECLDILGMEVPVDSISRLLESADREDAHGIILKYLGRQRASEAVELLERFVRRSSARADWTVELALEMLSNMDTAAAAAAVKGFLESPAPRVRRSAHLAFFSRDRQASEGLPPLVEFLNSDDPLTWKKRVLNRARWQSPTVFGGLKPEMLSDGALKDDLAAMLPETEETHSAE